MADRRRHGLGARHHLLVDLFDVLRAPDFAGKIVAWNAPGTEWRILPNKKTEFVETIIPLCVPFLRFTHERC